MHQLLSRIDTINALAPATSPLTFNSRSRWSPFDRWIGLTLSPLFQYVYITTQSTFAFISSFFIAIMHHRTSTPPLLFDKKKHICHQHLSFHHLRNITLVWVGLVIVMFVYPPVGWLRPHRHSERAGNRGGLRE